MINARGTLATGKVLLNRRAGHADDVLVMFAMPSNRRHSVR